MNKNIDETKKKVGRPKVNDEDKTKYFSVYLYQDELNMLRKYSQDNKTPMSRCVGTLIKKFLGGML